MAALILVPDSKNPEAEQPDPAGGLLSIVGLGLLLWAIIEAPTEGWVSGEVIGVGLGSLAVLGIFDPWQARSRHPMVRLELFCDRRFFIAAAGESFGTFGLLGALFVQTRILQFDLDYSPLQAGLRILPDRGRARRRARLSPVVARLIGVKCTAAAGLMAIAGDCGRLGGVQRCHDLWDRRARDAADRARGRPPAADGDQLRRGLGPPRRLRNRVGLQRRGSPGRWRSRCCRVREHPVSSIPGPYDSGAHRSSCADRGHADDPWVSWWRPCRGGASRWHDGHPLGEGPRAAFMSGNKVSLAVGGIVAFAGALLVLAGLPSRFSRGPRQIKGRALRSRTGGRLHSPVPMRLT